jgi:hypothetical protein
VEWQLFDAIALQVRMIFGDTTSLDTKVRHYCNLSATQKCLCPVAPGVVTGYAANGCLAYVQTSCPGGVKISKKTERQT